MIDRRLRLLLFAGLSLAFAACQGRPIPMIAAKGTTFVFPLPLLSINALDLPFGSVTSNNNGRPDRQRGDLVVGLCPVGSNNCTTPSGYLTTRYVTQVEPSPASPAGLRGAMLSGYANMDRQALALLEIPDSVTAGTYTLSVRKRVPNGGGYTETALAGFEGSNITIIDRPSGIAASPNPVESIYNGFGFGVEPDLADLVPYPTFVVKISDSLEADTFNNPAAADFYVHYPASVSIKGVYEDKHPGRQSIVFLSNDTVNHVAHISLVDPRRCTTSVRVAYDWVTGTGTSNDRTTPVALTEFTVDAASRTYNGAGNVQHNASQIVISERSIWNFASCPG